MIVALALGLMIDGVFTSSPSKTAARPTAGSVSVPVGELATQYETYWTEYQSAAERVDQTASSLSSDMTKQIQRYETDANTYSANEYGFGCDSVTITGSNPNAYSDCVSQEEETASNALNDEAAANTQYTQDRQQLVALDGPVSEDIDTFVQQLADMPWPRGPLRSAAEHLIISLTDERTDLAQEVNALNDFDSTAGDAWSEQYTSAESDVEDATIALEGALGLPAPPPSNSARSAQA